MPCRSNLDLTPAAFISLPPYNNGLPIPLFDFKPPQDGRLSINTLEGWNALVARTKKKAASSDCNTGSGGDQPEGQSKNQTHYEAKEEKSQGIGTLRTRRLAAKMTMASVAKAVGVPLKTYKQWETESTVLCDDQIIKIARALNCTADLLDANKNRENPFRRYRLRAGLTRREVAYKLSLDPVSIGVWERGKGLPCENNRYRVAELYDCTIKELMGDHWKQPARSVEDRNRFYEEHKGLIRWVMKNHKSVLLAVNADYADVFQELSLCMLKCLDKQDPQKGPIVPYLLTNLKYELLHYAGRMRAGGLSGLKRDDWRNYPSFSSLEAMQEAGIQI